MVSGLPPVCRLIVDERPRSGRENMALDAALLRSADQSPASPPVVRIYQWDNPTLSLGYFQKLEDDTVPDSLIGCPHVRRLTGGGAILHDQEITYSCVVSKGHPVAGNPVDLYRLIHGAIKECLSACGVLAGFRADLPRFVTASSAVQLEENDHFLCFLRSDPRDLALNSSQVENRVKIVGSAQRRRRGTILQHGSIMMRRSPLAPEISGICNLFPDFDVSRFLDLLPDRLGNVLAQSTARHRFSETETEFAFEYRQPILQNTPRPDGIAQL